MVVRKTGGPEVLERESFDPGIPGPGEALIAQEAIGLNFIDTYFRTGLYPLPLPTGLGSEAAGIILAVGEGVSNVRKGDRVAYVAQSPGSYATHRIQPANRLLKLPDAISCETAAGMTLKGLTAAFLVEECAKVTAGQTVLVHSAAGGVGSILVPWLKSIGAKVIAHSGSQEKADRATAAGATHSLHDDFDALAATVRDLTDGKGVDTVFDGVGAASWQASLDSLRPRGLMISFGNASGPVPPFSVQELAKRGSLFLTRPTMFDYIRSDEEYQQLGARLFEQIARDVVKPDINQRFPLDEAADAHRALESRQTVGSTILIP
ncbi:quinone oxidoreductase [Sphingobium sp. SCG-1]|nr:quinone oxidoreductase [Sphingobium sp. SCG-1]